MLDIIKKNDRESRRYHCSVEFLSFLLWGWLEADHLIPFAEVRVGYGFSDNEAPYTSDWQTVLGHTHSKRLTENLLYFLELLTWLFLNSNLNQIIIALISISDCCSSSFRLGRCLTEKLPLCQTAFCPWFSLTFWPIWYFWPLSITMNCWIVLSPSSGKVHILSFIPCTQFWQSLRGEYSYTNLILTVLPFAGSWPYSHCFQQHCLALQSWLFTCFTWRVYPAQTLLLSKFLSQFSF